VGPIPHAMGVLTRSQTPALAGPFVKVVRLASNPIEKQRHFWMLTQCSHIVILAGEFAFTEERMQLAVTDPVQPSRFHTASRLWHQMMSISL